MEPKSTGIYLRISDDREGRELGVQRQEEDCRAHLGRLHQLVGVYKDNDLGASTLSKKRRPDFERLMTDAQAGRVRHIVAYTTSRLTRRPKEFEELLDLAKTGVTFSFVRSPNFDLNTADGRATARTLAAWDAAEAERTGERVARAKQQRREQGLPSGIPRPFGYEPGGLVVREREAAVVRELADRVLAGESLWSLVRDLNERGVPTAGKASAWSKTALKSLLLRPRNAALLGGADQPLAAALRAAWPPLLDEDTWRAVVAILTDPGRAPSPPGNKPRWLGTRLYRCGVCERQSLVVTGSPGRYTCRPVHSQPGQHVHRRAAEVDTYVERTVVEYLARPEHRDLFAAPRVEVDVRGLSSMIAALRQRRAAQLALHAEGELTDDELRTSLAGLRARIDAAQAEYLAATAVDPVAGLLAEEDIVRAWFGEGPERVGGYSLERRRLVVDRVARVAIHPHAVPGRNGFDPSTVEIVIPRPGVPV